MRYAVIKNGKVANIAEADAAFAEAQGWVEATGAAIGDDWDGATFTRPEPPIEDERARLHEEKDRAYRDAMRPISEAYPVEEREGWAEQVRAAQDVKGGNANALVDKLRGPTGETATQMADRILALRDQYLESYGNATAARRGLTAQIDAATTLADLHAIDINAAFTA